MKRGIILLLVLLIIGMLAGCVDYSSPTDSGETSASTEASQAPSADQPQATEETHIHNYLAEPVAATCTEEGYVFHICQCGDSFADGYTDPLGHAWNEWWVTVEPTTEQTGLKERACDRCGATDAQVLGKLEEGHVHSYSESIVAPDCLREGYSLYSCACGSAYRDKVTAALGHDFGEYVSNGDATCTADGTKYAVCGRCDEIDTVADPGSMLDHSWGEWEVTAPPTAEAVGWKMRSCLVCGATDNMQIDSVSEEHVHSYQQETVEPTCAEDGYIRYSCQCGDSYREPGAEALGHSWGEWVTVVEPTESVEGVMERVCAVCGETERESVASLPGESSFVIVEWTQEVLRNTEASVTIRGVPGTEYTITVYYKSGPSTAAGLEPAVADENGYVTWVWKVGGRTAAGTYEIQISCEGETQSIYFTVLVE